MQPVYQIPRNSLAWLLLAYAAVVLPLISLLPVWMLPGAVLCLLWRIQVHRALWRFPSRLVKYLVAGTGAAGLVAEYGRLTGLEPMIALLVLGFALKLLEMHQRRDALLVIYLSFLLTATQLLLDQSIVTALYAIVCLLLSCTALMGLNQTQGYRFPLRSLAQASRILLQSIPFMLLLFLLMPRLGALWSVPLQQSAAKTGMSDSMSPGDISRLIQSDALVMRATFEGALPEPKDRYWRALIFSAFDGRTWSRLRGFGPGSSFQPVWWYGDEALATALPETGQPLEYEVILEPTQENWLYALMLAVPASADVGLTRDHRLVRRTPVINRTLYRVRSVVDSLQPIEPQISAWQRRLETRLPEGFNPKAVALAQEWREESADDLAYIRRVLDWFNRDFRYTLQPPALGRDTVDDFLFDTQAGFCEHFAGSFTFMMRAANIPARVVVGYQGGELNPYRNYLSVYQFDAHAWSEVWLPGEGWKRVDPTAAVAPERIEQGSSQLRNERDFLADSPLSLLRYQHIRWLNNLRLQFDQAEYFWHRSVLGYGRIDQEALFRRWLGGLEPWRIGAAFLAALTLILLPLAWRLWRQNRAPRADVSLVAYRTFCRKLQPLGLVRKPREAPGAFAQRVAGARPDLAQASETITRLFEEISYQQSVEKEAQLSASVRAFRPKRKPRTE